MTDIDLLWLRTLEELGDRAAHEIKDTLNGVSLSLEVVRGRSGMTSSASSSVSDFAATAAAQLELVTERIEAMLVLSRRPREPADVAMTLRRLASLMVPAAKADGASLTVEGAEGSATTRAAAQATRLALGALLLQLVRHGGGKCRLEAGPASPANGNGGGIHGSDGRAAVVRFSHEAADACTLDPEIQSTIEEHGIRVEQGHAREEGGRRFAETLLVFPGYP